MDTDVVVRPVADFEIQHGQVLPAVIREGNDATGNVQKHDVLVSAEVTAVDMEPWLPPESYPVTAGVKLLDGERQLVVPFLAEMRTSPVGTSAWRALQMRSPRVIITDKLASHAGKKGGEPALNITSTRD